jgi:hypothetical protein
MRIILQCSRAGRLIRGDRLSLLTDVDAPGSLISLGRPGREEEESNVQSGGVCHHPLVDDAIGRSWLWPGYVLAF